MDSSLLISGVTTIKGEISSLMTNMRLTSQYLSTQQTNAVIGTASVSVSGVASGASGISLGDRHRGGGSAHIETEKDIEEALLVQQFRRLNEMLEGSFDLKYVDVLAYILPFHSVIISKNTSGPLTSTALSSLSKFALYGFLRRGYPRVKEGMSLIARYTSLFFLSLSLSQYIYIYICV